MEEKTEIEKKLGKLLELTINNKASDLHLIAGYQPTLRVNGELFPIAGEETLTPEKAEELVFTLLKNRKERFLTDKELDFSYSIPAGDFRVNVYFQRGWPAASLRYIRAEINSLDELNLPSSFRLISQLRQGFILVAGPTGHGKSTTVAALLEEINRSRRAHIITIEDPVEYRIKPNKCMISQRELEIDTLDWARALRSCLREDPDVVFIGEMRDLDAIKAALTIAETGHLVFSTLHTNSAAETIDRIIDVFPGAMKEQIQVQLANTLSVVISQRLVPRSDQGRVPAVEVLVSNPAVRTAIREHKTHLIDNIILTSTEQGMCLLEASLAQWVKKGIITLEAAELFALRKTDLTRFIRRQ